VHIAVDDPLMPESMRRTLEESGVFEVVGEARTRHDVLLRAVSPRGRVGRDEARRVDTAAACGYCGHPSHPGRECGCDVPDGSGGFPCGCCPDLGTVLSSRRTEAACARSTRPGKGKGTT
jgi:hypothetical protein